MSNKENKKHVREEKKQAAKRREQRNSLLWKVGLLVFIPLVLFVFYQGLFGGAQVYAPDDVAATDHVRGAEDAPVTMTVYADFQCPQCLTEAELIRTGWQRISDKVQFVFRFFPLDTHRHSFTAARYAEAAGKQNNFWGMHDVMFANQTFWAEATDVEPIFDDYAERLGLDMDQLHNDIESDEVRKKIVADQKGGVRAGVRSTPAMFLNGNQVDNPRTVGELIRMVDEANKIL